MWPSQTSFDARDYHDRYSALRFPDSIFSPAYVFDVDDLPMTTPPINIDVALSNAKTAVFEPSKPLQGQASLIALEKRTWSSLSCLLQGLQTKPFWVNQETKTPPGNGPFNLGSVDLDRPHNVHSLSAWDDYGLASRSKLVWPGLPLQQPYTGTPLQKRGPSPTAPRNVTTLRVAQIASQEGQDAGAGKMLPRHSRKFECTLCYKRFTRAYNLRSHLRTHSGERPFVCTRCGKVFARKHDRTRHESLHSGKKKFVCKGDLIQGGQWGCGRLFARKDALGRHLQSKAGGICIKPFLDEEKVKSGAMACVRQCKRRGPCL